MKILALNSPRGDVEAGEFGLACLPGQEGRFRESIGQALDYGRAIGAGSIHVMAGRPTPETGSDWQSLLVRNIGWACDAASDFTILMEPLNRYDNPGYAYATADEACALLLQIDRRNVRLMLDAYHEARGGFDPALAFVRHRAIVGHVQIAGVPARHEPEPASAMLRNFFQALLRHGYEGWVGCEYKPAVDTDGGLGWLRDLEEEYGEPSADGRALA